MLVRRPDGTVKTLARGFWRARGLALTPSGSLYLTTEANYYDHGNSGLLACIDPSTSKVTPVLQGLDYPQFPCATAKGRVFFVCNRDSWLVAYDPQYKPSRSQIRIVIEGQGFAISPGGWLRIPAQRLALNRKELYTDRGDPEHPQPGIFALPSVSPGHAIALRGHGGQRFPMTNPGTAQEAPPHWV